MSKSENWALQVHQLTVNYDRTPVLWDLSLQVPEGKLVGVIGPNGAGKSTFLKAAMGLVCPLSGKVDFFGRPLKSQRQRVAYIPQRESVDWDFPITVLELVLMGRYGMLGLFRWSRHADKMIAMDYLEKVGMARYADRQISQLSGGQQQRVFLARALMQEADVYLMDEPFAGIDMTTQRVIIHLLRDLRDQGKTLFVVHHALNDVEDYFDWLIILNMRLLACGSVEEVFNSKTLSAAYGKSYSVLDEALKLSRTKGAGITK